MGSPGWPWPVYLSGLWGCLRKWRARIDELVCGLLRCNRLGGKWDDLLSWLCCRWSWTGSRQTAIRPGLGVGRRFFSPDELA
jgi:hypothetical protein